MFGNCPDDRLKAFKVKWSPVALRHPGEVDCPHWAFGRTCKVTVSPKPGLVQIVVIAHDSNPLTISVKGKRIFV
eukprot:CAMPEP_0197411176 /NCGR_PEP_ID=MMETSP1165-20131217/31833_1 /TAXON_ID=284809 /ORGANISM="Chrysocystis fragilis, Strain CCMP3189" /LENGTH=73 /DNA_ID=CAMNT_0042937691 /DNA_START=1536 /DNA_END=1753 /DNA_ORIENTATION=+